MGITIIGAGLAGCEAAWRCAEMGVPVSLVEQKPRRKSPAHKSGNFAELVCSNSLRSDRLENAAGLLKEELRRLGSLIIQTADRNKVPAGGALAVDREQFSKEVTEAIRQHPLITISEQEVLEIPKNGQAIIATGPLTDGALARDIENFLGAEQLSFYDASAPLIARDSVDMNFAYRASRYGKDRENSEGDYINCPLTKEEYLAFRAELAAAEEAPIHGFEDKAVFEGCMPVEVMARRGLDTLRFSAMRPIGLRDPKTDKGAFAVLQLRQDNSLGTVLNMVGFQTHLTFPEQKRVFSMIKALHSAEFLQYGVMHRNTYINSPLHLNKRFQTRKDLRISFAGQITGVEGYIESTASGLLAGMFAAGMAKGLDIPDFPSETAVGALSEYISNSENFINERRAAVSVASPPSRLLDTTSKKKFQPTKIHFGLLPPLSPSEHIKDKQEKARRLSKRALRYFDEQCTHTS